MDLFKITPIQPETAHETYKEFLSQHAFIPTFFFSPYSLNIWMSLHLVEYGDEKYLAEDTRNEFSILFDRPSKEMIEAIYKERKPKCISIQESVVKPTDKVWESEKEYTLDASVIANLEDADIRKSYNQAVKKNEGLVYEEYKTEHIPLIKDFLKKWENTRTEEANQQARIFNDTDFLDKYGNDPEILGGVVMDKGEVVGYTLCVPSYDGNVIALFNKVLRGYTELGVFLYVERARQFLNKGIQKIYIGWAENGFKKRFLMGAEEVEVFKYEV